MQVNHELARNLNQDADTHLEGYKQIMAAVTATCAVVLLANLSQIRNKASR